MAESTTYSKYAIFEAGGRQYQGVEGKTIAVDLIDGEPGSTVTFDKVLFRKTGEGKFEAGKPYLTSPVKASIIKHTKTPKVIVFKFKRRKKVRVKQGHRQQMTVVRVESV